ncbi:two pore domain potassium channel family protein, partial [Bifidobacterium breve]|nr:two pore domain potassium channel family protein [Bifidobacterium breve]
DAREKEVAKEAAQEAIAVVAAKARVPEGTKRAAAPGSAASMPPSPEIELAREEVREFAAMVAGLRAELERR